MFAWQFVELQMTAQLHGWTKFVSMQNHYNLIYREEGAGDEPVLRATGVALTPWSPLARGILAGAYKGGFDQGTTARSKGGTVAAPKASIAARWISGSRTGW